MTVIHPIATEILRSQKAPLRDGTEVPAHSFVTAETCEALYDTIGRSGATRGIEVGMAFGVSSVCLADALRKNSPEARLVAFDPTQSRPDSWNGAGLWQVERAGLSAVVELREESSQSGLPRLFESGYRCGFAFIDGWHTFDHTLIDFFFIDRMLEVGGHVAFDDIDYPAVETVLRFILSNRHYEIDRIVRREDETPPSALKRVRGAVKKVARRVSRTDRDPSAESELVLSRLRGAKAAVLRKLGDDDRRFDHFRAF